MHPTLPLLRDTTFPAIRRTTLQIVQVNLGYRCNQTCLHCHVNAGPTRTEQMSRATMVQVLRFALEARALTLDLTGGAPELNPHFRWLVAQARTAGVEVIDRCNLTVLFEPGQEDTAEFLASHRVRIVALLPCYLEDNVDAQRGRGTFSRSIEALWRLNGLGYGQPGNELELDLVYNPQGAQLPPPQAALESAYREHLARHYGVAFSRLLVLANMPIQRFGSMLVSRGEFDHYMALLRASHRAQNITQVMCRHTISIDWQGYLYDCDFNQMLGLALQVRDRPRTHVSALKPGELADNPIAVMEHCYGCTAGQGSGCAGALSS